jgi:hypothetical protein
VLNPFISVGRIREEAVGTYCPGYSMALSPQILKMPSEMGLLYPL